MLTSEIVLVCTVSHLRRTTSVPSVITVTLNSSARWQLESVPWTVTPVLIVRGASGLVGDGRIVELDAHDTLEGEMMTTQPEHAASGSRQRTSRDRLQDALRVYRSTPGMVARQGRRVELNGLTADACALLGTTGVGLRDVFEDEELLAGLDEAELAAGEVLDRRLGLPGDGEPLRAAARYPRASASDCSSARYSWRFFSISSRPFSPTRASRTSTQPTNTSRYCTARRPRRRLWDCLRWRWKDVSSSSTGTL